MTSLRFILGCDTRYYCCSVYHQELFKIIIRFIKSNIEQIVYLPQIPEQ